MSARSIARGAGEPGLNGSARPVRVSSAAMPSRLTAPGPADRSYVTHLKKLLRTRSYAISTGIAHENKQQSLKYVRSFSELTDPMPVNASVFLLGLGVFGEVNPADMDTAEQFFVDVRVPAGIEEGKRLRVPAEATGGPEVLQLVRRPVPKPRDAGRDPYAPLESDGPGVAAWRRRMGGEAAKAELTRLAVGRLECTSYGPSYSNVNASCRTATGADLSCEMLRTGTAVRCA